MGRLPLARVFVGLNDLAIERGERNTFLPLADGTVDTVRAAIRQPFGVAGLTLPTKGSPVPCAMLVDELARLSCDFTFLRRSFLRDVEIPRMPEALAEMQRAVLASKSREREQVAVDRAHFVSFVSQLRDAVI